MPRNPSRFVRGLSDQQLRELKFYMDHGQTARVRHRAHAIRLSYQGRTINEIAEFFGVDRDTVAKWLDRWDQFGIDGLADRPRPGAAPKLSPSERKLALELWQQYGQSPKQVLAEFERRVGKTVSVSTLKRIVNRNQSRPGKPRRHEQPDDGVRGRLVTPVCNGRIELGTHLF